jgi:hypothetical protein
VTLKQVWLLERLKKSCSHLERGFGEGAGLKNPVTELKRRQNQKRPLLYSILPNGYNIFENALAKTGETAPSKVEASLSSVS